MVGLAVLWWRIDKMYLCDEKLWNVETLQSNGMHSSGGMHWTDGRQQTGQIPNAPHSVARRVLLRA